MKAYARFHNASHLVAATGLLLHAVASQALGMGLVGVLLVFFSWGMFSKRVDSPVPRFLINTGLALASGYTLLRIVGAVQDEIVGIIGQYLALLLLLKLFERRTPRDQAQVLAICAMLGVAGVLTSADLQLGALLVAHTLALLVATVRYQVWAGHHMTMARADEPSPKAASLNPDAGARSGGGFALATTLLAVAIWLGGVGVFVLLPRQAGSMNFGGVLGSQGVTATGFRDHVQLGAAGSIQSSREIVGYVSIEVDGVLQSQGQPQYFRGAVLDEYDDGKWQRSESLIAFQSGRELRRSENPDDPFAAFLDRGMDQLPDLGSRALAGRFPPDAVFVDQFFELEGRGSDTLFALLQPVQAASTGSTTIELNPIDGSLLFGDRNARRYRVRSMPDSERRATADEVQRYELGRLSEVEPFRIGRLADTLRPIADDVLARAGLSRGVDEPPSFEDARIARALTEYLTTQYAYTTEMVAPDEPTKDPTLYFLQESRQGHCEYFASALAGLLRSVGIDARVVTGYVTDEVAPDGRYVIRQSNAHAWVEAPVLASARASSEDGEPRVVWRTFDASPAVGPVEAEGEGLALIATLREWIFSAQDLWVNAVIGYDSDAQEDLFGVSGNDQLNAIAEWMESITAPDSGALGGTPLWVRRLAPIGLAVVGCVLISVALRNSSRRGRDRVARDRVVRRIDRTLRRAGHERPAHRPLLDHAETVGGSVGASLRRAALALYAERFSGGEVDPATLAGAVEEFERRAREEGAG